MTALDDLRQVYVVTYGEYSDYGISSIWLTVEEAKADAGEHGRVEVWPIGENKRTMGEFSRSGRFDGQTGEALAEERCIEGPALPDQVHAEVLCSNKSDELLVRVSADTQERADKVYSETRARVLAGISSGLPKEAIADTICIDGFCRPTREPPPRPRQVQ